MFFNNLHPWPDSVQKARDLQLKLYPQLQFPILKTLPELIAGADIAYSAKMEKFYAGVFIINSNTMEIVEEKYHSEKIGFPYIPGYLSFRELPALLQVFAKIENTPGLIFFDGHGIAHPRKFGIASHAGLWLNLPTIGIAKKKLVGTYEEPLTEQGNFSYLNYKEQIVGVVMRTRSNTKPIFVSCGHRIDLKSAIELTFKVCDGFRIPFPTRIADRLVGKFKMESANYG